MIVSILQQKYWGGRGVGKFGEGEHKGREGEGRKERENYNQQQNLEQKPSSSQQLSSETWAGEESGLHYITEPALILASNLPKFIPPEVTLNRRKSKLSDPYVPTRGSWVCKVIVYCRSGWWRILCDPSTWEVEHRQVSVSPGQPSLHRAFRSARDMPWKPISKNNRYWRSWLKKRHKIQINLL